MANILTQKFLQLPQHFCWSAKFWEIFPELILRKRKFIFRWWRQVLIVHTSHRSVVIGSVQILVEIQTRKNSFLCKFVQSVIGCCCGSGLSYFTFTTGNILTKQIQIFFLSRSSDTFMTELRRITWVHNTTSTTFSVPTSTSSRESRKLDTIHKIQPYFWTSKLSLSFWIQQCLP